MARLLILVALATGFATAGASSARPPGAEAGADYFRGHCVMCHGNTATTPPGIGPRLFGVVGRPSGSLQGYAYSSAMKRAGLVWDPATLRRYVASPQSVVRGNKMPFQGISNPHDADNVVAYLATLH